MSNHSFDRINEYLGVVKRVGMKNMNLNYNG